MTTLVLADDHHLVRHALKLLLESEPDFAVVGETGDGGEVTELVASLGPDVLILDLMMPGLNGLQLIRQVSHSSPHTRVIILSMHSDEAYVKGALASGAAGYVLKDAESGDLVRSVRDAVGGRRYLSPRLSDRALDAYAQQPVFPVGENYNRLTPREREVLGLAANGLSSSEVAIQLSISPRTAETHRSNLMQKLGLHSQTDLVRYALRLGIMSSEGYLPKNA